MKLFVTGGTGFIGSHFLRLALAARYEVHALRRPGSKPRIALSAEPMWADGSLAGDHSAVLRKCDAFVHLAAVGVSPQAATWEALFRVNVSESVALWRLAMENGVRHFVICGSCFEYGRSAERFSFIPPDASLSPTNGYGASKAAATVAAVGLAQQYDLALTVLRPFHVFGEGQHESNFWPALRCAAHAGEDFSMTAGEQVRDFTPVEDVAAAFLEATTIGRTRPGQPAIQNLGTGHPTSLRAFAEAWWREWQARGQLRVGALPYRKDEIMRYVPEVP